MFSARKAEAGALPPQGLIFPLNAKVLHMSKTSIKYLNPGEKEKGETQLRKTFIESLNEVTKNENDRIAEKVKKQNQRIDRNFKKFTQTSSQFKPEKEKVLKNKEV